jgi:mRNA interferase MazF
VAASSGPHAKRGYPPPEVPATRTIRGLTTEVVLTPDDGMPAGCALNFDRVSLALRNRIGAVLCGLPEVRG